MGENTKSPLVILGLDVGDPDSIEQWTREGYLPTIASLMQRGAWGRTGGAELISELGIWVSVFSGLSRAQHNYFFLRQVEPGTYNLVTFNGKRADAQPFWHAFRERNKKIAIADIPDIAPIPGIPGFQLADWAVHYPFFSPAAEPRELYTQARRALGSLTRIDEKLLSRFEDDVHIFQRLVERIEKKGAFLRELLQRDTYDLITIVFGETHTASHQFWRYRPEPNPDAPPNQLTHAIREVYVRIDRELGLILQQVPQDANVFLIGSNGVENVLPTQGLVEAFMRQLGYQIAAPPSAHRMDPLSLARRAMPEEWRIALGKLAPAQVQARILANQLRTNSDWSRTRAYPIPATYASFLRVNLRGREPAGIVAPGHEYDALLCEIESDLSQLIDPQTNAPAIRRVDRATKLYGCDPHPYLPDLIAQWQPSNHFVPHVHHPRAELHQVKPGFYRENEHSFNGFIAAAGPRIQAKGRIDEVSILDLTPTFLLLLNEEQPYQMTGQPLFSIVRQVSESFSFAR